MVRRTLAQGLPMQDHPLRSRIDELWEGRETLTASTAGDDRAAVEQALDALDSGALRVAEKGPSGWVAHEWLKKAVLLSFRLNDSVSMPGAGGAPAWDKVPMKTEGWGQNQFAAAGFRAVPGAVVRRSAYVAPGVVLMPSFVNVGAYVDRGTMVDTWATVGSCAQVGRNCHLSGGVGLGGVLEPLQANPTIIEDDCFIGARSEVVEGGGGRARIGAGHGRLHQRLDQDRRSRPPGKSSPGRVPAYSVVVPGTLPGKALPDGSPGPSAGPAPSSLSAWTRRPAPRRRSTSCLRD